VAASALPAHRVASGSTTHGADSQSNVSYDCVDLRWAASVAYDSKRRRMCWRAIMSAETDGSKLTGAAALHVRRSRAVYGADWPAASGDDELQPPAATDSRD